MKAVFVFFLFLLGLSFAQTSTYMLGIKNSKYAYIGLQPFERWGIAYENSLFSQDIKLQYGRLDLFYIFEMPFDLRGCYVFFLGTRYNMDYYDIGGELDVRYDMVLRYLQIKGILQPRYDSDIKGKIGYSLALQTRPFEEIGFLVGIKNLPEYRNVERRVFAGLSFEGPHLKIVPEISFPLAKETELMRVTISFVYLNLF